MQPVSTRSAATSSDTADDARRFMSARLSAQGAARDLSGGYCQTGAMNRPWLGARLSRRRTTRAGALVVAAVALAAGCSGPARAPVEEHTFGMHQVISSARAGMPVTHVTYRQMLDTYRWEITESSRAAMEWWLASDCSEPAPATEVFVVACDSESAITYLLRPAALTDEHILGAEVVKPSEANGFREGELLLGFTDEGEQIFSELTGRIAPAVAPSNQMAIVVDGVVVSAPKITQQITGGGVVVSGSGPNQRLNDLAAWLDAKSRS